MLTSPFPLAPLVSGPLSLRRGAELLSVAALIWQTSGQPLQLTLPLYSSYSPDEKPRPCFDTQIPS